jgi:hypothetical protein
MRSLAIAMLMLLISTAAFAQEEYIELLRSDVRSGKIALITEAMQLTPEEGEIFWPIYREYDLELNKLADRRIAMIKDFGQHWAAMTDEKAKEISKEFFDQQKDRVELREKYFKKIEKEMSATTAAKFVQIENQLGLLIDLQIASEIPLLQPVGMAGDSQ